MALGAVLLPLPLARARAEDARFELPRATSKELETSPYVYLSPLHPDGAESRCHGAVWFMVHESDVIVATGKDRWKTRALEKGWDRARVWVGDYGSVKAAGDKFRAAPSFEARASREPDPAVFEVLMSTFAKKYPDDWGKWEPRFREGFASGSRVLIRYRPIGA